MMRSLLLKLVVEQAIAAEERAYRFYGSVLEKGLAGEAEELVRRLRAEELAHRLRLEEVQKRGELGRLAVTEAGELRDLEAPRGRWPKLGPDSSREQVLEAALLKEKQAWAFYRVLQERSSLAFLKELFAALAAEERRHVLWVEELLGKGGA